MRKTEQKIKGLAQQAEGEIHERLGHRVKGGMKKIQGKINEEIADTRMKADNWDDDDVI